MIALVVAFLPFILGTLLFRRVAQGHVQPGDRQRAPALDEEPYRATPPPPPASTVSVAPVAEPELPVWDALDDLQLDRLLKDASS